MSACLSPALAAPASPLSQRRGRLQKVDDFIKGLPTARLHQNHVSAAANLNPASVGGVIEAPEQILRHIDSHVLIPLGAQEQYRRSYGARVIERTIGEPIFTDILKRATRRPDDARLRSIRIRGGSDGGPLFEPAVWQYAFVSVGRNTG